MLGALEHRGPDAKGKQNLLGCSLGHTRLRVIDLSPAGDQPMSNEDGTVWVVFNGEIYNFAELRRELQRRNHRFRSTADTEVLVHLYEEHGERLAERLQGMFAFAIWDERSQRLLLVRDRLGIKPLYYRIEDRGLSFASEVQALTSSADSLNLQAVGDVLRLGWVTGAHTIISGIEELPPAHTLIWKAGQVRVQPYWTPKFLDRIGSAPTTEELTEALSDAMRQHVVADVPVGVFLSSGVDSAIVTKLARAVSPEIRAYTIAFETGVNEAPEAALLARKLGVEHAVVEVGGHEVLDSLERVIGDMDQPTVDGVNAWVISRTVREAGLVVALSGLGGDELFGGYSTFRHVPRLAGAGRGVRALPSLVRDAPAFAAGKFDSMAHSRVRRAMEAVGAGGWEAAYCSVRGLFGAKELESIWSPARLLKYEDLVQIPWGRSVGSNAMVGQLELANYLPYQLLRDTDCMSMAHALEVRVPLLDDRVVELAIAGQCAVGARWNKSSLVSAVDRSLGYLTYRPKKTFTLPFDSWMRGALRERVLGALGHLGESELGFDRRQLTDLWHGYLSGRVGWRPIWALAVLGMWIGDHNLSNLALTPAGQG